MNAARPRYASVLPPPVGKKSRSTNSRSGLAGFRYAGEVQQDEGELERPPAGLGPGGSFASEAACESGGDGTVRGAKGVERVRVVRQQANPALHPIRGDPGEAQELLGGCQALARQSAEVGAPGFDPRPVLGHERRQRRLGRGPVRESPERLHAELRARHVEGLRLLDLGGRGPGGAEHPTGIVHQLPVRGDPVARRVLRGMGVVEVGHALIPVVRGHLAGVGARDERHFAPHLDLGLKGERLVPLPVGRGLAAVHQEQGHGAGSGSDPACEARGVHGAGDHVEGEPSGVRYPEGVRVASGRRKNHRNRFLAGSPLPPTPHAALTGLRRLFGCFTVPAMTFLPVGCTFISRAGLRLGFFVLFRVRAVTRRLIPAIVAPADHDLQRIGLRFHQEAQPHGRGEEALLRGLAVFNGVVAETRALRDIEIVVHVRIAALLGRHPPGDQKSREIPVGRPHPARQALVRQRVPRPRPDEIESERLHDLFANLGGFRQTSHVTPENRSLPQQCSRRPPHLVEGGRTVARQFHIETSGQRRLVRGWAIGPLCAVVEPLLGPSDRFRFRWGRYLWKQPARTGNRLDRREKPTLVLALCEYGLDAAVADHRPGALQDDGPDLGRAVTIRIQQDQDAASLLDAN